MQCIKNKCKELICIGKEEYLMPWLKWLLNPMHDLKRFFILKIKKEVYLLFSHLMHIILKLDITLRKANNKKLFKN